jgi:hypothetical protein
MYNVVYKRMLLCNHFGFSTFTFHLNFFITSLHINAWGITYKFLPANEDTTLIYRFHVYIVDGVFGILSITRIFRS